MNRFDLEEALIDLLGDSFSIEEDDQGQLIIFTGLCNDDDNDKDELVEFVSDDEEDLETLSDLDPLDGLDDD